MNRSGVVFKKYDTSYHRPKSVKRCVSGTCQHTCQPSQVEKCSHAWTLRYRVNGKQLEKSFRDTRHPTTGRVIDGGGEKLAQDFQLSLAVEKRPGDITFADHGQAGKQNFGEACEQFIERMNVSENSRDR